MSGWVKLFRKLKDSAVWNNHQMTRVWTWCLMSAGYLERVEAVGYREVCLLPGQFITGRRCAAMETGLSEQTLRSCFDGLERLQMITRETVPQGTVITIVNWAKYQGDGEETSENAAEKPGIQPANQPGRNSSNPIEHNTMKEQPETNQPGVQQANQPAINQRSTSLLSIKETTKPREREISAREDFSRDADSDDFDPPKTAPSAPESTPTPEPKAQMPPAPPNAPKGRESPPDDVLASARIVLGLTAEPVLLDWRGRGWAWDWQLRTLAECAARNIRGPRAKGYAESIMQEWTREGGPPKEDLPHGHANPRPGRLGRTPAKPDGAPKIGRVYPD